MVMNSSTCTRAAAADAAEVVALEVDQHHVLGPFLLVAAAARRAALRRRAASRRAAACRRSGRVLATLAADAQQPLRRRTQQREAGQRRAAGERRRVRGAQPSVQVGGVTPGASRARQPRDRLAW